MKELESIVIGCGPAGLQAAIYLSRSNINTAIIGKKDNSRLFWAHTIENYFGFPNGIEGEVLINNGILQAKKFNTEIIDEEVLDIKKVDEKYRVISSDGEFFSKTIIFTTGVSNQSSGILKEKEFTGKGVAFCVMCDGLFFKDKNVIVVGEGDYAAKEALDLLEYTKNVTIYLNGKNKNFTEKYLNKLNQNKIEIKKDKIIEFTGENKVDGSILENGEKINFDGAFIAAGMSNPLTLSSNLDVLSKNNFIVVDKDFKTNIDSIFAAGDATGFGMQVATAVGSGAKAAMSAISYIRGNN